MMVMQHWVYKTFGTKQKGVRGEWILDFRSESGQFQVVEEEGNTHAREILARRFRNNGTQGVSS